MSEFYASQSRFTYSELQACPKSRFFLVRVALALFIWILNPSINTVFLRQRTIYQRLFQPDTHDIFKRSVISAITIIMSFTGSVLLIRSRLAEEALRESEERCAHSDAGHRIEHHSPPGVSTAWAVHTSGLRSQAGAR